MDFDLVAGSFTVKVVNAFFQESKEMRNKRFI